MAELRPWRSARGPTRRIRPGWPRIHSRWPHRRRGRPQSPPAAAPSTRMACGARLPHMATTRASAGEEEDGERTGRESWEAWPPVPERQPAAAAALRGSPSARCGCGATRAVEVSIRAATLLDSLVGSCAKRLQDIITEEAILILGVKGDIKELQRTMNQIRCFLNDAEERRTEESAVHNWLCELKDAMYEADDIIDLARLEGSKLLGHHPSLSTRSTACTDFSFLSCLPNIPRRHKIAHRIRNFNTELEKISMLGERFLRLKNVQPKEEISVAWNMKSCELVEPNLVGKEISLACSRLVEQILAHKKNKTYKVGIVGTGGIGKTSLAQIIYNDHKIKGNFSKKVWICVSQVYSKGSLLKELLRNLGIDYLQDEDVGELSRKLAKAIENNSFFLVLDDVWEHEVWSNLLRIPIDTASTSIVLVTTRNNVVARKIGVDEVHQVDLMSEDVGWELLCKSMDNHEEIQIKNLRDIGMDIVRMCGGLPLAVKVIARVLATKDKTEKEWRKVRNGSAWSMSNLPAELRGALYLSYDDLPRYLKQCFLYCSLYPEDWVFHRDHLIRCWIAEGFVQEQEEQLLEDIAEEYFYELIYRNLLQPDPSFLDYSRCRMHDLLRQLAQHLTQDECFCGEPQSLVAKTLSKLRRVSIVTDEDYIMLPDVQNYLIQARTLFVRGTKSLRIESEAFRRLSCLRVLDLTGSIIQSIPDCVGQLIHLRLLDLNGTDISYLPESIGSLIYLQILNLQRCDALHSLPLAITKLCNLRRLGLKRTPINQVPKGIGKLKFLNDLEGFPIGGGSSDNAKMQVGWNLEELEPLLQLRRLEIKGLEGALSCGVSSLLVGKRYLNLLSLWCTERTDEPYSEEDVSHIENLFEELTPPKNLEDLAICQYFGPRYPSWLGSVTNLHSLEYLRLKCCKFCVHLPPIGQLPNLKYLKIKGAAAVTKITSELLGCGVRDMGSADVVAFPKLEMWVIDDMPNLVEWTFSCEEEDEEGGEDGATTNERMNATSARMQLLPCLKDLDLVSCPKLRSLPWQLGQYATSLRDIYLSDLKNLKVVENLLFLSKSICIVGCECLERISNLPKVRELYAEGCPNLRCIDKLDNLQQLWLDEDMEEVSSLWLPGLQERCQELHDEDLELYNWN